MTDNFLSIFWIFSLILAAGLLVFFFWLNYYFRNYAAEYKNIAELSVQIPDGASIKTVSQLLAQKKIIDDAQTFYWYLRLTQRDIRVHAGNYIFTGKITNKHIAERLIKNT